MRSISNWKKIVLYMILPEDTTGTISQDKRVGDLFIHNLCPCLGFIKGIFWVAIAIIGPIILPVLIRVITGS